MVVGKIESRGWCRGSLNNGIGRHWFRDLSPVWLAGMSLVLFFSSAIAQEPVDLETYELNYSKGLSEFGEGRYDTADALFGAALAANPGDAEASYYLGQSRLRLQKFEEAEGVFRKMLETDTSSGRAWLGLGMIQYNRKQYNEALISLAAAEKASPNDPLVYYYQGLIYHEQEEFEKSQPRFLRAMTLSPDLAPSAHYFSGVAFYRRGIFDEARTEFEAVITTQPQSEFADSAQELLAEAMSAAPPSPKRWTLNLLASSEWDSNVILSPNDTLPPGGSTGISRKGDYRTTLYARGEYRAIQTDRWSAGASYGVYQSFHRTLSGFDVQDHSPTVFVQHQIGPLNINLQYVYNYTLVGRAPYLIAHAFQPIFTLAEGSHAFTQFEFRYQNKDFQHGRFPLNSARDGKNWLAGVTQYFLFAENKGRFWGGYAYDTDRTGGGSPAVAASPGDVANSDWAYKAHRFLAGLELPPIWTVKLDLAFDYYRQNYDNPNTFSEDGLTRRRDNIYSFGGTLSRDLTSNLTLAVQYHYTRDENNLEVYDYNRSIYSFVLSGRF